MPGPGTGLVNCEVSRKMNEEEENKYIINILLFLPPSYPRAEIECQKILYIYILLLYMMFEV